MATHLKVLELRAELSKRSLDTSGTKPTLVRRLEEALSKEGIVKDDDAPNTRAAKKRERVDEDGINEEIGNGFDEICDIERLQRMNIQKLRKEASNRGVSSSGTKKEIIQRLCDSSAINGDEVDGGGLYMVYNRWGRVGVKGQDKLFGPYSCRESATEEFEAKFLAKTKNHWSNRKDFVSYPKCYTWLEMDYSEKEQDHEKPYACTNIQPQESKLEPSVAKFISLICNISMMRQQMMEIGYNAEKLPLGKLSKSTILKGYDVLKRLSEVIGQSNKKLVEQLSGEFYTVIPHDFGFKKMREFVIDTPQKLKNKLEMVEALGEIELATKLLSDDMGMQDDPLYAQYERLHCQLIPVEVDSEEFSMIQKYTKNTHAKTHSDYNVDIVHVFRVSRQREEEQFKKFASSRNRMLLWHGSRLTNWTGILSQGLRIAPPEAPVTGYMFGKGVYFADMFSKSANYCFSSRSAPTGVLLLCEVALGEMEELLHSKYDADKLPAGKLSTKGIGSTEPNMLESQVLDDVVVPFGKPVEKKDIKGSLLYNEYIVYNVDQIRMRYVIQVKFNHNR